MESILDYFRRTYDGSIRSDCCSHMVFEATKPITVQELCNYILSNDRIWGYIGIACPENTVYGDPNVEYAYGKYVDDKRNPIEFEFPSHIANAIVKRIDWDGGYSRADWVFTI